MMVKLFSFVMAGLLLIQNLDVAFSDLGQIDELMEHAHFHSEKYGDNLFVFISKHYGEMKDQHNKDHQEEEKDHEKLPFQHHCSCSSTVAVVSNTTLFPVLSVQTPEGTAANFYYQPPTSSIHAKGLFQPPQSS
ncbi:MAG: hypothetical protein ACI9AV_002256 [Sediminicola sp.]|jgi:hypothetical protein